MKTLSSASYGSVLMTLVAVFWSVAVRGAAVTTGDNLVETAGEETVIEVPDGTVNTYTGTLTLAGKLVKRGLGKLILANGANTIAGGIDIQEGPLALAAQGAQGGDTAPITITGGETTKGQLILDFAGLRLRNPISVTGVGADTHALAQITSDKNAIVDSAITSDCALFLGNTPVVSTAAGKNFQTTIWNGTIMPTASSLSCYVRAYGTNIFNNAIGFPTFSPGNVSSMSDPIFLNAANAMTKISLYHAKVYCGAEGTLGTAYLENKYGAKSTSIDFDLQGHDQTLSYLYYRPSITGGVVDDSSDYKKTSVGRTITSATPATITFVGSTLKNSPKVGVQRFNGQVSLAFDFTEAGFEQVLSNRQHLTSGKLDVLRGRLRLMGTTSFPNLGELRVGAEGVLTNLTTDVNSFHSVTNVVVDGTLFVGDGDNVPFTQRAALRMSLGADAHLRLPMEFPTVVGELVVAGVNGGAPFAPGTYGPDAIPQLESGSITVLAIARHDVWTGGGATPDAALAANWQSGRAPDLSTHSLNATFAAGGEEAVFAGNAKLRSITLAADDTGPSSFVLRGADDDSSLSVDSLLSFASAPDAAFGHVWDLRVPTSFESEQAIVVPTNHTLRLAEVTAAAAPFVVSGDGVVELSGTNRFRNAQISAWPAVFSGRITNPDGSVSTTMPTNVSGSGDDGVLALKNAKDTTSHANIISNAYVEMSLLVGRNSLAVGARGLCVAANTTNVFAGPVFIDQPYMYNYFMPGSRTVFRGGLSQVWSGAWYGDGTGGGEIVFEGAPIRVEATAKTTMAIKDVTVFFAAPGSYANILEFSSNLAIGNFLVDDVFRDTPLHFTGSTGLIDMKATHQTFDYIYAVTRYPTITGDYPAVIEVKGVPDSAGAGTTNVSCKVTGGVGFTMAGPDGNVFHLKDKYLTSCGDIAVKSGTLEFGSNATWLNGTNVTVKGTGRLKMNAGPVFGRHSVWHLSDSGVVTLPDGVEQRAAACYVDGVPVAGGIYTYATAPTALKAHLDPSSTGSLRIAGGFVMIVR